LYGNETWTLLKVDKYLKSFEVLCWRGIEKIRWTDCVINEEVLQSMKEKRNVLQMVTRRNACFQTFTVF